MKNYYDLEKLKSYDIRELGFKLGLFENEYDYKGFCPVHEKNGEHNPSLMYRKYNNTCRCFKCSKTFDNISLIQSYFNIRDFKESCAKLEEITDNKFKKVELVSIKKEEIIEEDEGKKEEKYENAINNSTSLHNMHSKNYFWVDSYLQSRCINYQKVKPLLEENGLEIRHCFCSFWNTIFKKDDKGELIRDKNDKPIVDYYYLDDVKLAPEEYRKLPFKDKFDNFIMFHDINNKIIVRRNIEDFLSNKEIKHDDRYRNISSAHHSKINNNANITIIFEGFIDMLSFISNIKDIRKYNYISLNSINNKDKFISEENMDNHYWIMVDNDEAGDEFVEDLLKVSISSIDCRYMYKNYNDVNDSVKAFKKAKKEDKNGQ